MKHDKISMFAKISIFAKISLNDAILWQFLCSHLQASKASETLETYEYDWYCLKLPVLNEHIGFFYCLAQSHFTVLLVQNFSLDWKFRENKGLKIDSKSYCFPGKGKIMGKPPNHTFFWHSDNLLAVYLALSTTISVGVVQNLNSFSCFPRGGEWPEVLF